MNPRLAIAIICLAVAGYILAFFAGDAFGEPPADSRSPLHFTASAAIGVMTGAVTQKIETPWLRRTAAMTLCSIPGGIKESKDGKWSWADTGWNLAGCGVGLAVFEGVQVMVTDRSITIAGIF